MQSDWLLSKLRPGGTVLCLGAHSDDIEIGCGGTLLKLAEQVPGLTVHWVVLCAKGRRAEEARASAEHVLEGVANRQILLEEFRNGFFPYIGAEIKEYFESLKTLESPDVILTHCLHDRHQDHRTVAELTWNTFRDHAVLEYEIAKYDGDLGSPNAFVTLTEGTLAKKIEILDTHFGSQRDKQWFTADTFRGLCRLRGIECNSPTGLAEAFYARKLVLG